MKNKKRDTLKNLIQQVELDKPSIDFTASVMEEVMAREVVVNPALKALLKRNGIESPSINFTERVMVRAGAYNFHKTYKPIISNKTWGIMIAATIFVVVYFGFSTQTSKPADGLTPYVINMGGVLNTVLTTINGMSSLYLITFVSLSALLVMDYFLSVRRHRRESGS